MRKLLPSRIYWTPSFECSDDGAIVSALQSTTAREPLHPVIDAHVHVWSDDILRYPFCPHDGLSHPAEEATINDFYASAADANFIDVVLIQPRVYGFDHAYVYDVAAALRGHARVVPSVNVRRDRATKELRELAADPLTAAFRVVALGDVPADWLSWPSAHQAWETAAELDLPVDMLIDACQIPLVEQVAAAHPDLTIIIDHMARCTPTFQPEYAPPLYHLAKHSNIYMKLSAVDRLSEGEFPFKDMWNLMAGLYREYGPSRLLWGSDWPHLQGAVTYRQSSVPIREALPNASEHDIDALFTKTAASLFGFNPIEIAKNE